MIPLGLCSLAVWAVIFERLWIDRNLKTDIANFHSEAMNVLIRQEPSSVRESLKSLCSRYSRVPTSQLLLVALERLSAKDVRLRESWGEVLQRERLRVNMGLRRNLWMLGTIGSSAPFIGLFGTVIGILRSFHEMARTGAGGFTVVASGISESLIATAAGIVVAVVAVVAYNAFQTRWSALVLEIRLQTEELTELLRSSLAHASDHGSSGNEGPHGS